MAADHDTHDHTGVPGVGAPDEITDIPTAETDTDLVLRPDGAGGVEWASASSGGYPEGNAFPGSPSSGDLFYRTDLAVLCFYDGTRWLAVKQDHIQLAAVNGTALSATAAFGGAPAMGGNEFYMETAYFGVAVGATNNGSNYWQLEIYKGVTGGGADASLFTAVDTQGVTAGQKGVVTKTINALMGTNAVYLYGFATKVGSPSNLSNPTVVLIGRRVYT